MASDIDALELDDVGVRFGGIAALSGVTLRATAGQRWAIIGPNGAGKTTLFKIISGEQKPTTGTVSISGTNSTSWSQQRRARAGLSRTFQINSLFADLTVEDNVTAAAQALSSTRYQFWYPVRLRGMWAEEVDNALELSGLTRRRRTLAAELSHGEARQLEIAIALAQRSRILLLDEPAAGLSPAERAQMTDLLSNLDTSITIFLIEHDMNMALGLADRVLVLNNGVPIATGTPQEIRENDAVQQAYLGAVDASDR
jgi:branched-chain amino acid transport system ATP-binding protein